MISVVVLVVSVVYSLPARANCCLDSCEWSRLSTKP